MAMIWVYPGTEPERSLVKGLRIAMERWFGQNPTKMKSD
jgi:hypothetical protein